MTEQEFWRGKRVLVTGGCSFIGSHLVEHLVGAGAKVRVADDLSSGRLENLSEVPESSWEFVEGDLCDPRLAAEVMRGVDVVFHLAAIHGGRGFIELYQAACSRNFVLDGVVSQAAVDEGVENFVFASSGCVYPVDLQADVNEEVRLTEPQVGPPFQADGIYGWAKLMTEQRLAALHAEHGFPSVSCRLFTVYGERCPESHALTAMVGRAFIQQKPFEVWGDGTQIRNWTYVTDIVRGLVLAAERVHDGSAINLGTEEPIQVKEAARMILEFTGQADTEIKPLPDKPTGPYNRVASAAMAYERLGWTPEVSFHTGLKRLAEWYFESRLAERMTTDEFAERLTTR
ncbi:NAD-dependent epimerase/dehydratase family protein [Lentzea flaviverrucosa]|uniref:UDP-glucose 4-epimerase/GDP-L-fucose synthase n=1 Tax=Lentzea flaviverrucosa TaxID=200379 RepID=A0A1H9BIX2_9PSEU|nr:NAD-dependent epimerase/dehydratase family protein [Lentzea flaviverrucosa]RDI31774.1 UDP-glucose 4-epimerase/GDP-L-fucose synthase [Lentzea flaviverrucosa]SEP88218.1 UDP-glucose 4-epimerase/GDP-L-fucose synthase [Lentzea flaviverrucosa]